MAPSALRRPPSRSRTSSSPRPARSKARPPADDQEAIVITGSRIPQPNLTATSPVTVVNSAEVRLHRHDPRRGSDQLAAAGLRRPEQQPFRTARPAPRRSTCAASARSAPWSWSTAAASSRAIPARPAADINVIPGMMIQRVDVLTGGASSVYGSDAVSGVVNFIMDTNFTGVRLDVAVQLLPARQRRRRGPVIAALERAEPQLRLSDRQRRRRRHLRRATWRSAPRSTTIAATSSLMPATARPTRHPGPARLQLVRADLADRGQIAAGPGTGGNAGVTDFTCGGSATSANGTFFTNVQTLPGRPEPDLHPGLRRRTTSRRPTITSVPTSATRSARSPITRSATRCSRTSK